LNETSVNRIISILGDFEAEQKVPFDRFSDTLEAHEVELNFKYVIHVSLYRRLSYSGKPPIKSAILATDSTMIHYAQLHALITQGSPIHARVFQKREAVAKWLGVPIEGLTASSSSR
jgi:hypothetical protein